MAVSRITISLRSAVLGGNGSNTWHFRHDSVGPLDFSDAEDCVGWIKTFYQAIMGFMPIGGTVVFDGQVSGVGPTQGETFAIPGWTLNTAGSQYALPPATAMVVGWRSETGGRSGRGRTFVGPLTRDTSEDNGTPNATVLGQLRGAAAALIASSMGSENGAVGVWSPQDSVLRDFTSSVVRDQYAVLRSRRD